MRGRGNGYRHGGHWAVCDLCGKTVRQDELQKNSDGLLVCQEDWEGQHPQERVRARFKSTHPGRMVRTVPDYVFIPNTFPDVSCDNILAVSGEAIAGCATAGTP